ncbi:MAG: DUF1638 domain-containing protein [Opitutaceae bacterium]|nr:DUF1638 domain-containing protein [Opitutaceae bacterium]
MPQVPSQIESSADRKAPWLGVISCSVFENEIALLGADAPIAIHRKLPMGLHDQPGVLRQALQVAIDTVSSVPEVAVVVLVYGLCGRGTHGLRAGRVPLVIPRAHDCVTLFLGSLSAYLERQERCPGCYYYTPGWNRDRRVPGPDRLHQLRRELEGQFDADAIDYLVEVERESWRHHATGCFVELGTADAEAEAAYAHGCARSLGWRFEHVRGDPSLLRDLLHGRWDCDRFIQVNPGEWLAHDAGPQVFSTRQAELSGQ